MSSMWHVGIQTLSALFQSPIGIRRTSFLPASQDTARKNPHQLQEILTEYFFPEVALECTMFFLHRVFLANRCFQKYNIHSGDDEFET